MSSFPQYVYTAQNIGVSFVNADSTNLKTLIVGAAASVNGPGGTRVACLQAAGDDSADRDLQLWLNDGSTDRLLTTIKVPLTAGSVNNIPPVNLLNRTAMPGLQPDGSLLLKAGWTLKAKFTAAVTAAKTIYISGFGGDLA